MCACGRSAVVFGLGALIRWLVCVCVWSIGCSVIVIVYARRWATCVWVCAGKSVHLSVSVQVKVTAASLPFCFSIGGRKKQNANYHAYELSANKQQLSQLFVFAPIQLFVRFLFFSSSVFFLQLTRRRLNETPWKRATRRREREKNKPLRFSLALLTQRSSFKVRSCRFCSRSCFFF